MNNDNHTKPDPIENTGSNDAHDESFFNSQQQHHNSGTSPQNHLNTTEDFQEDEARGTIVVPSHVHVTEEPMYDDISNRINLNSREQSKLLVRHITRTAISGEHEDMGGDMSPALKRRLRDFRFAQRKRRERYGVQSPWGIIGLYDHLTGIRTDIEWAEDAAWRRENDQPYLSWQDFEEAKDTGFNQPFFTYFTMLVCTICLVISIGLNGWTVDSITNNPMIGPNARVLILMGAKYTPSIVNDNEWYRIFTAMVSKW